MFKKVLFSMFLLYAMSGGSVIAAQSNYYSVYAEGSRTSRFFLNTWEPVRKVAVPIDYSFGFGFAFNSLRMGGQTFSKGWRAGVYYHLMAQRFASPYVGLTYIQSSGKKFLVGEDGETFLNGFDATIGLSLNLFKKIINPFVEYNLDKSFFIYGLRVSIPIESTRIKYD